MMIGRDISVIIPVLNEKPNIETLLEQFDNLVTDFGLSQIQEVIFVDDGSSDGTIGIIKNNMGNHSYNVRLVERSCRLGTVNATITGCNAAVSDNVVIMDGDLQHPPHVILEMTRRMHDGHDVIVASRHVSGGRNVWKPLRGAISRVAIFISHLLVPATRKVKDSTSGFFMIKKNLISSLAPHQKRAKILLYVLASFPELKSTEIPYTFVDRKQGSSKIVGTNVNFITNYMIEVIDYMRVARRRKRSEGHNTTIAVSNQFYK